MTGRIHSSPRFPQFSTVHHTNCEHCPHHTTTVVAVGCGECVVEAWHIETKTFATHTQSTVGERTNMDGINIGVGEAGKDGGDAVAVEIEALEEKLTEMRQKKFFCMEELIAQFEIENQIQRLLKPNDRRHKKMFETSPDNKWLTLFWGGYPYEYELSRINRPDDLMWLIVHLSKKSWREMTAKRIGLLIERISQIKGWPAYGHALHPNEAPKPNFDKIGEREKMTSALRYAVIRRDGYRCRACGFAVQDGAHLHVDHIVPIASAGRTELDNLQTLCTACNLGKGCQ